MTHKQKVLALLSDGRPRTHREIYALGVVAHSRISDLRKDGYQITCTTEKCFGETVSVYQLHGSLDASSAEQASSFLGDQAEEASSEPVAVHPDQASLFDGTSAIGCAPYGTRERHAA